MLTLDQVMMWLTIINLWTKSHGVTIQINPLWQNFWTVLQLNARILQKKFGIFVNFLL